MESSFWHEKWQANDIGFHEADGNSLLKKHWPALCIEKGSRVFVPLCGKTRDISWLLAQGYAVVAIELSEVAIIELFAALGVSPAIETVGSLKRYSAEQLQVFVGDIFDLDSTLLGSVDAIYDRAALVALPETMRERYTAHLQAMTHVADQFVICFEYDQQAMSGPPFSINEAMMRQYYGQHYRLELLQKSVMEELLKGRVPATDLVWFLSSKPST